MGEKAAAELVEARRLASAVEVEDLSSSEKDSLAKVEHQELRR